MPETSLQPAYFWCGSPINYLTSVKLGFIDLTLESVMDGFHGTQYEELILAKMRKARTVYWANLFTDKVKADNLEELTDKDRLIWGVTWDDEYWSVWNDK